MAQHARPIGPTSVTPGFDASMVQGALPDRSPRDHWRPGSMGWTTAQLTHVASSTSTPEQLRGTAPVRFREALPVRRQDTWLPPDVPNFDSAMTQGWAPARGRELLGARIPQPVAQTTPVTTFSIEMATGTPGVKSREKLAPKIEGFERAPDILNFDSAMVQGWLPQRARILLGARIPLPWSQPTHTSAPITLDMLAGYGPSRKATLDLRLNTGLKLDEFGITRTAAAMVYHVGPLDYTSQQSVDVTVAQLLTFTLPIGTHD